MNKHVGYILPATLWICFQTIAAYAISGLCIIGATIVGHQYLWAHVMLLLIPFPVFYIPFVITLRDYKNPDSTFSSGYNYAPWSKAKISLSFTSLVFLSWLGVVASLVNNRIINVILVTLQVITWISSIVMMNAFTKEK